LNLFIASILQCINKRNIPTVYWAFMMQPSSTALGKTRCEILNHESHVQG
jgi:hypothetical protein